MHIKAIQALSSVTSSGQMVALNMTLDYRSEKEEKVALRLWEMKMEMDSMMSRWTGDGH